MSDLFDSNMHVGDQHNLTDGSAAKAAAAAGYNSVVDAENSGILEDLNLLEKKLTSDVPVFDLNITQEFDTSLLALQDLRLDESLYEEPSGKEYIRRDLRDAAAKSAILYDFAEMQEAMHEGVLSADRKKLLETYSGIADRESFNVEVGLYDSERSLPDDEMWIASERQRSPEIQASEFAQTDPRLILDDSHYAATVEAAAEATAGELLADFAYAGTTDGHKPENLLSRIESEPVTKPSINIAMLRTMQIEAQVQAELESQGVAGRKSNRTSPLMPLPPISSSDISEAPKAAADTAACIEFECLDAVEFEQSKATSGVKKPIKRNALDMSASGGVIGALHRIKDNWSWSSSMANPQALCVAGLVLLFVGLYTLPVMVRGSAASAEDSQAVSSEMRTELREQMREETPYYVQKPPISVMPKGAALGTGAAPYGGGTSSTRPAASIKTDGRSVEELEKLLAQNPDSEEVRLQLIKSLIAHKQYERARLLAIMGFKSYTTSPNGRNQFWKLFKMCP